MTALLAIIALPHSAAAAVPGLQLVQATSPTDSNSPKGIGVFCPRGKVVIGTGGRLNATNVTRVVLHEVIPATPTSVRATGIEIGTGTSDNWSVTAYAICANNGTVPGLEQRSATSTYDSTSPKSAVAGCPDGKKVIGAGGSASPATGVALRSDRPTTGLFHVNASATETGNGTSSYWNVTAYAFCANDGAMPGLELISAVSDFDSTSPKSAVVSCPTGKRVIGAAGSANTGTGVVLTRIQPSTDLSSVRVGGIDTGTADNWSVTATAVCATP
jgi:hypothetical protein